MSETFDAAATNPASGGENLCGDRFTQAGVSLFLPAGYLVFGPVDGPYTRVESGAGLPVVIQGALPVTDDGASLTVDGTIAATQSGAWTVEVTNVVSVSASNLDIRDLTHSTDSVTAYQAGDWTVAATQSGAWSVSVSGTIPVTDGGGSLTIDGTIAATQSGVWNVYAYQGSTWLVSAQQAGTWTAHQGGAWTVAATQSGAWAVNASQTGTWAVNATQSGTWTVTASQGGTWNVYQAGSWTVAATQSGAWSVSATQSGTWTADTELPTAAALAEGATNPTTPIVGAADLVFNGTSWDRRRGTEEGTLLTSATRTTTTNSTAQTNYNAKGVILWLNIGSLAGSGIPISIVAIDPVSGNEAIIAATTARISAGVHWLELHPGAASAAPDGYGTRVQGCLPRQWKGRVTHTDGSNKTYSLGYTLLP